MSGLILSKQPEPRCLSNKDRIILKFFYRATCKS